MKTEKNINDMSAKDFVKKFGWSIARIEASNDEFSFNGIPYQLRLELKRLTESYDLIVNDFESIDIAKYEYMISASHSEPYWVRVKQAIIDMEYCKYEVITPPL